MDNQPMPDSLVAASKGFPASMAAPADAVVNPDDSETDSAQSKDTVEAKRLNDTQIALKEAQRQFHEMKGQIAQMNAQLNAQQKPAEQEVDILQSEDFLKRFDDDPAKGLQEAIGFERNRLSKAFVEIMDQRDKEMEARMQSMLTLTPQKQHYSAELGQLGQSVPGFETLPQEMQVQMAKAVREAKGPDTLIPPGSPAGSGYSVAQRTSSDEARKKQIQAYIAANFGSLPEEGAEQFPTIAGIGSLHKPNGAR